jgi:hypothetical protein
MKTFRKTTARNKLDKLWSEVVRKQNGFVCQWCLYDYIQNPLKYKQPQPDKHNHAHHIVPKSKGYSGRWEVSNGVCLCFHHHIDEIKADPDRYIAFRNAYLKERELDYFDMRLNYNEIYIKLDQSYYEVKIKVLQTLNQVE